MSYNKLKSYANMNILMSPKASHQSQTLSKQKSINGHCSLTNLNDCKTSKNNFPGISQTIRKKLAVENLHNIVGTDYEDFQPSKFKSEMNWINTNNRNSSVNNEICLEYGYSNLSYAKSKKQKSQSN